MTTYHVSLNIDGTLQQSNRKLRGLLSKDGRPLSAAEVRAHLISIRTANPKLEVLTPCDNQDERGYCLGHPAIEKATSRVDQECV